LISSIASLIMLIINTKSQGIIAVSGCKGEIEGMHINILVARK